MKTMPILKHKRNYILNEAPIIIQAKRNLHEMMNYFLSALTRQIIVEYIHNPKNFDVNELDEQLLR